MNEIIEEIHAAVQQAVQSAMPNPEPIRDPTDSFRRELAATERRLRDWLRGMRSVKERSRPAPFVMPVQSDAEKRKSIELVLAALRCRKGRYLSAAQLAMVGNVFCATGEGGGIDPHCGSGVETLLKNLSSQYGVPEKEVKIANMSSANYRGMAYRGIQRIGTKEEALEAKSKGLRAFPASRDGKQWLILDEGTTISLKEGIDRARSNVSVKTNLPPSHQTLIHEFGHVLQYRAGMTDEELGRKLTPDELEIAKTVSPYAKTKYGELLSEAFVLHHLKKRDFSDLLKGILPSESPVGNASPVVVSKLAPYLHELLGDVTKKQSRVIARAIKRGIDRKWADSTVARLIADKADIDPDRAKVIARTEMRRAKADIQLGKKRDSAKVVFMLGNEDACPICRALDGKVFTVRKAQGVIPVHPNCYCFWSDAAKGAKVTRNFVINCGGEGSGRPGPCPEPDLDIKTVGGIRKFAIALRKSAKKVSGGDLKDWCVTVSNAARKMVGGTSQVWSGYFEGREDQAHSVVKVGGYWLDVTADQFGAKGIIIRKNLDERFKDFTPENTAISPHRTKVEQRIIDETAKRLRGAKVVGNSFRDSLLRFSALNQFCATGAGGGIDPTCSGGGNGTGGTSSRPSIGAKFSIGGVEHEVSGYGFPKRTGPNKGRDPVVLKDAEGNRIVRYTDELGGAAPEPVKAATTDVGKPGGKGTKSKTPKEVPQSGKTKFNYDDTLPEGLSAKTRDKMLASGELQYTEAKARAGDIESWHQDWYAEGIHPSDATLKNLKKTVPQETITLYRGHPRGAEHSELEAWTTDKKYALDFAGDFKDRDLISREVHPSEIVSDMSKINPDDSEVVVASGAYAKRMAKLRGDVLVYGSPVKVIQSKPTTNQFCATGEGGGIDPSCPSTGDKPSAPIGAEGAQIAPSKVSPKRAKQVLADADKLKVDDDLVHGKGDIDVDDLDAIEELLTGNEKRKLESYVESAREFYVDLQMEDFEATDFPEREWADEKGYGSTDLKDEALARLKDWSNEEGVERVSEALEDWDKSTRQNGVEAMDELRGVLEDNDAPQFLKDEFDEKYASMESELDSARESWDEDMERSARSEAENGFDAEESKNEFLRQFVEENSDDPRFGGGKRTYDTWGKSAEDNGDNQLFFQTSKGNEYEVWDNEQAMGQGGVPLRYREIGFNDASGDFGVTGAGNAVEVFGKASAAVVKLLKEKDYDVASFTAAEPSRQRLYDRLVRTVSSVLSDYAAFSYQTDPGSPRRYVVAKKTKADQIRAEFAKLPNGKVDVLANADTPQLVPLTPEVREEWFTEAGWADTTDNAFCPTGEGGGVDPSCSPGGKGGSVDDIEDDYDRRESRVSQLVSRLGKTDQERAILEKGLNGTTERALKLFDKNVSKFSIGRLESPESTVLPGIYRLTDKSLVVDSRAPDPDRTFVHEWGHALDGPKHDFSESPAWGKIWKEEIVGGAHSLSPYSKTSVYEGFAEFATLVRTDSKKAKSQFPRAYRYWTDADLTWDDA